LFNLLIPVICCLLLLGCGKKERTQKEKDKDIEIGMQIIAEKFVRGVLKDPDSATFRNWNGPCGEVNSKNSFGGFTGYQRFIAASEKLVILENDSGLSGEDFQGIWNKACKYRPK